MNEKTARKLGEIWATQEATEDQLELLGGLLDIEGALEPGDQVEDLDLVDLTVAERIAYACQVDVSGIDDDEDVKAWEPDDAIEFWNDAGFTAEDRADWEAAKYFAMGALRAHILGDREAEEPELVEADEAGDIELAGSGEPIRFIAPSVVMTA